MVLGLGGVSGSPSHALKTADALNAIAPGFVRLRTLVPKVDTLLLHQINKGRFQLLSPRQVLEETRRLLEILRCHTRLTSDHYTNYLNLAGHLPEDKARLLEEINDAMKWPNRLFRPHYVGTQ